MKYYAAVYFDDEVEAVYSFKTDRERREFAAAIIGRHVRFIKSEFEALCLANPIGRIIER